MIAKDNVLIGLETRFGADWPGQRCGAKTRRGTACQRPANKRNGRCRLHGFDSSSSPNWLIWNEPLMAKITASELDEIVEERTIKINPSKPTFDFNQEAQIT